ncbi:hypothetical protein [Gulosibacter sp. 10]|uniref:hypothetical protein n=1 Tax=Gulosibacter sp. 10 TaxID=1255570 RepID=UPI00097EFD20|nr:hypothetical protein [Gulosibacter sp. 10]SJM70044.1 Cdd2 protein [Gulosibacter sp. 10]
MPCSWRLQRRGPRAQGEQRELHPVAGIAVVLQGSLRPLGYLIPQALNTNMLNLGSRAVTDAAGLSAASAAPLLGAALVLLALFVWLSERAIRAIKLA